MDSWELGLLAPRAFRHWYLFRESDWLRREARTVWQRVRMDESGHGGAMLKVNWVREPMTRLFYPHWYGHQRGRRERLSLPCREEDPTQSR